VTNHPNNLDDRPLVLLSVASRFGRDAPSLFRVHLCTLLFIFTHPPHPLQLCEYWDIHNSMPPTYAAECYSLRHMLSYSDFHRVKKNIKCLILIVTDDYCCMEWFNPPTHRSVCSDTLVRSGSESMCRESAKHFHPPCSSLLRSLRYASS